MIWYQNVEKDWIHGVILYCVHSIICFTKASFYFVYSLHVLAAKKCKETWVFFLPAKQFSRPLWFLQWYRDHWLQWYHCSLRRQSQPLPPRLLRKQPRRDPEAEDATSVTAAPVRIAATARCAKTDQSLAGRTRRNRPALWGSVWWGRGKRRPERFLTI